MLSGFERIELLNSPPHVLLSAIAKERAKELRSKTRFSTYAPDLERIVKFQCGMAGPDVLFEAAYDHSEGQTCDRCSVEKQEARQLRDSAEEVVVHYSRKKPGQRRARRRAPLRDRGGGPQADMPASRHCTGCCLLEPKQHVCGEVSAGYAAIKAMKRLRV
jgi:hypothetical protein